MSWLAFAATIAVVLVYGLQTHMYDRHLAHMHSAIGGMVREHNALLNLLMDKKLITMKEYCDSNMDVKKIMETMLATSNNTRDDDKKERKPHATTR